MNQVITISSTRGTMVVDFVQRRIFLKREGNIVNVANRASMSIAFGDITAIELKRPTLWVLGSCTIIVNNIRYITSSRPGTDITNFAVEQNNFELLESTLKRVLQECNLDGFKELNSVPAQRIVYTGADTNFTMSNMAQNTFNQMKEKTAQTNGNIDIITEAKLFAQSIELQLLKSPASAKFCSLEDMSVTMSNNVYTVRGYVDSQNSYCAMIRTPFVLQVFKDETGWKSADKFESTEASINKQINTQAASNILIYWILGIIGAAISFAIAYATMSF